MITSILDSTSKLSTPHGTLGTQSRCPAEFHRPSFQLHTVHQELLKKLQPFAKLHPFNSTRYIRNNFPLNATPTLATLSTPHGTLGTQKTACPLNHRCLLSTPHGTLGTIVEFTDEEDYEEFLSTPHGTLGTYDLISSIMKELIPFQLHTVHQELSIP